jgi:tetratricopeptide (TPR) repeat protein
LIRQVVTHIGVILLIAIVVWIVGAEVFSNSLYIAPVDLPKPLKDAGITEQGVAVALREEIQNIRMTAMRGSAQYSAVFNVENKSRRANGSDNVPVAPGRQLSELPELVVPQANLSLTSIAAYLRAISGLSHTEIIGRVDLLSSNTYGFHLSVRGTPVDQALDTRISDVSELIHKMAVAVETQIEPDVAVLYFQNSNPDRAIEILKSYLSDSAINDPIRAAWAFDLWGNILRNRGQFADALDKYLIAARLAPEDDQIAGTVDANLGSLYLLTKNFPSAEAEYMAAIKLAPKAASYSNLGIAEKAQHKYAEALASYKRAIELDPSFAPAYSNMGVLFFVQNQWREAKECYEQAISISPGYADRLFESGCPFDGT